MDTLPLGPKPLAKPIIAECELMANQPISAKIYFGGNTLGQLPTEIPINDTFTFSLGLANVDAAFKFIQDENNPYNYFIKPTDLKIEAGKSYRFTGIGDFNSLFSETIRIPEFIQLDVLNVTKQTTTINNKIYLDCSIKINGNPRQFEYIQIKALGLNDEVFEYIFEDNFTHFKNLKHKNGFLINNEELITNTFNFILAVPEDYPHDQININVGNATDIYYLHNAYQTDNMPNQINLQNPLIYPMNIKTPRAQGVFSSISINNQIVDIK